MSWKCPSCGRQNYEAFSNCAVCCYSRKGGVLVKEELKDCRGVSEDAAQCLDTVLDCTKDQTPSHGPLESHDVEVAVSPDSRNSMPDEEVIKEIDSWLFTFSRADSCISIGTPALRSFRLKISMEDLEDLLEIMYQKTGNEKTTRKLSLTVTDIIGVIDKVDRLIEEKKSKVSIKFTTEELQEVADLINLQLSV